MGWEVKEQRHSAYSVLSILIFTLPIISNHIQLTKRPKQQRRRDISGRGINPPKKKKRIKKGNIARTHKTSRV